MTSVFLCLWPFTGDAQTIFDGSTPSGAASGAPVGSASLSEMENINLFSGHLNLHVPIIGIGGRGDAQAAIMLAIDNQWSVRTHFNSTVVPNRYEYYAEFNRGSDVKPGYGPGLMVGRMSGEVNSSSSCGDIYNPYSDYLAALTRITFVLPDGTEYELRDQLTGGRPLSPSTNYPCHETGANRGRVFVSADGSAATFISDGDILDAADTDSGGVFYPTGYLMLRDGTRLRIEGGRIRSLRDRNGNSQSFNYLTSGPNYGKLLSITDALGRTITINYDVVDDAPYGLCDQITYKGFGATDETIRVSKSNLHNALRSDFSIKTDTQLFPNSNGGFTVDPVVTTSLWLPNGQRYKFYYNSYVEVARVELPTGGAVEYDYGGYGDPPNDGFFFTYPDQGNSVIYRRVIERRVSSDGISWEGKTKYSAAESEGFPLGTSAIYVHHLDSNDAIDSTQVHYFSGSALDSMVHKKPTDYSPWKEGREYKTEFFAGGDYGVGESPVTPLRVITREWAQRAAVNWWRTDHPTLHLDREPPNDPRLVGVTTTVIEPIMSEPGNLISKQRFDYDLYNNLTDVYDYAFSTEDYPFSTEIPANAYRHTHTGYLTVNPANGIDYSSTEVHIRNLPTSQIIYNGGVQSQTVVAASETFYDENAYAPLTYSDVSGWVDPGTLARGNATTTRTWLNINGGAPSTYPAGTYLMNHVQYDQCGNARNLWDAKGRQLTQSYEDAFADGPRNTYALLTRSTAPPVPDPSQSGATISLVSTKVYDFSTGLPISETGYNGETTEFSYDDPLSRLKTETRPSGGGSTTYEYGDTPGNIYVRTLTSQNASETVEDYQCLDGLGRATRSFHYRGNSLYETSDVRYDFMGRVSKLSNPYLSSGLGSAVNPSGVWSTTKYDSLGRVTKAIRPDGSETSISYTSSIEAECTAITVIDPAGKARRQLKDAFGRTTRVDEPDDSGNLGDVEEPIGRTRYDYDPLDNLVQVRQFNPSPSQEQTRTFLFDSLKRLVSATNPENGTISYQYDENGNLVHRTDARDISTTNDYDALNRIVTRSYSDDTPAVTYVYDSPAVANSKGRLVSASSSVSASHYDGYDSMGRPQGITHTIGSQSYSPVYTYDWIGHVTSLTYPSGRKVNYTYDVAGRTLSVSGNLGDGSERAYSADIVYSAFGRLSKEQFGTVTPIYNKLFYNVRGQLKEMRVGTTYTGPSDTSWNRGAIVNSYGSCDTCTNNNGNVSKQEYWIPGDDNPQPSTSQIETQEYEYDSLNRTHRVHQGTAWQEQYVYDNFGNRKVDANNTSSVLQPRAFEVESSTNRLLAPGDSSLTGSNINQRLMRYDDTGNLINDSYNGEGRRDYDAENRMTRARANNQWQLYSYDAAGQRILRNINGVETLQIYGINGELLAEYGAAPTGPCYKTVSQFVRDFYQGALKRQPNSTELADATATLTQAQSQGQAQLIAAAQNLGSTLISSQEYASLNTTESQFVTDLYAAYLQRNPDLDGYNYWYGVLSSEHSRPNLILAFAVSIEFRNGVAALCPTSGSALVPLKEYGYRNGELLIAADLNSGPNPSPSPSPSPTASPNQSLVISQVYGGGGNSSAVYRNDFIEIFNGGTTTVDLTNWSIQYAADASSSWHVKPLSGSVAPGHYYLVQGAQGTGGTTNLPTPDATDTVDLNAAAGKVVLSNGTAAVNAGGTINDLVGYGSTASQFEGSGPTSSPNNTSAVARGRNGCIDLNNNTSDFDTALPVPRNSASAINTCSSTTGSTSIVISEFRTRGPNGGNDEFIELYNLSNSSVDISGWKIKASNSSGSTGTRVTINANTTLAAHKHFLVTNTNSSLGYSGTTSGDQIYSLGIGDDGGVALTKADDSIVDQAGMSAGSAFKEGRTLQQLTTNVERGYERKLGGTTGSGQDTNDNKSDFAVRTPSEPQNLQSSASPGPNSPPTVSMTAPADDSIFIYQGGTEITVAANDGDGTISKVEFFAGSTLLGQDMLSPYSLSWNNIAAGTYALTARATDNLGVTTTSTTIHVTVIGPPSVNVSWLVTDERGTPRMVLGQSGSFASVSRHDYLPFGGDLAGIGGRSAALGYAANGPRQKFTQKERDTETGLDYFGARYYSNISGRFTSPDEPLTDQNTIDPQSWNLYSYVRNRPVAFIDPLGRWQVRSAEGDDVTVVADGTDDLSSLAEFLSVPLNVLTQLFPNLIARRIPAGQIWSFSATWVKSVGGKIPQDPIPQTPPTPTPSQGDPNNKCDERVYGAEMQRERTGIARTVGGRFDDRSGRITGLENVQSQYVVRRFESAGFSQFRSFNSKVHPGVNLERQADNDSVWYHVTVEPGTGGNTAPPGRITIHCDNAANHTAHHFVQDYLGLPWPF